MTVTGTVLEIFPIESGQGKKEPWSKQLILLETPGQYKKKVIVMYWNAMVDTVTRTGHEITVHVSPESREYNGRWYTELRAWKTEQNSSAGDPPLELNQEPPQGSRISQEAWKSKADDATSRKSSTDTDPNDDLPF